MASKGVVSGSPAESTANPSAFSDAHATVADASSTSAAATGNKKKQKRRQKQAARQAVADEELLLEDSPDNPQLSNDDLPPTDGLPDPPGSQVSRDAISYTFSGGGGDGGHDHRSHHAHDHTDHTSINALSNGESAQNKKKKKSKPADFPSRADLDQQQMPPPPPRPLSEDALRTVSRNIKEGSIWDTNGPEERSRIKAFWLGLSEKERKDLVNIEKSHVLQKMKEQQKHSCSCTVCGRKRTAIEEELEVLYAAYAHELQSLACGSLAQVSDDALSRLKDPRIWADPTTNPATDRLPSSLAAGMPSRRRIHELANDDDGEFADDEPDDEDYNSEEFDEDEDDEYLSDADDIPPNVASDFFQFGNSLTVKDGILTVADDLLKNDGQKFIDMMEQLAERRMQREEDARYNASRYASHPSISPQHGHPGHAGQPPLDEDDYEDDEDDDYDDEDGDYDDDEDEMDGLTEDQRMEEGRRMFQIFAARMFEQRVVTAYREKVAWERQQALINEQEQDAAGPSEAKKARNAEKKKRQRMAAKEAKAQKEAAKEEEKQKREAAAREAEEKKKEEQRLRQEEQRKKKEAERKAQEEKKKKKEADVQRKLDAERERQQEQEKKQRELKAEEKRRREEADKKKREEREAKENEVREKKAQEENERKEREAKSKADKEAQNRNRTDSLSANQSQAAEAAATSRSAMEGAAKRIVPPATVVALPPSLKSRDSYDSPSAKIATPALPKAPTPSRPKDTSSQRTSTPHTPERTPQSKQATPPRPLPEQPIQPPTAPASRPPQQHTSSVVYASQMSPTHSAAPIGAQPYPGGAAGGMAGMGINGYQQGPPGPQRLTPTQQMPMYQSQGAPQPPIGAQSRQGPQSLPQPVGPPSLHQQRPRAGYPDHPPSIFGQQPPASIGTGGQSAYATARDMPPAPGPHSRHPSNQFEGLSLDTQLNPPSAPQPIGRPAHIKRPASVNKSQDPGIEGSRSLSANSEIDDLSNHLGSSALLDDSDEPLPSSVAENRRSSAAPGSMRSSGSLIGSPFESATSPFSAFSSTSRTPGDSWGRAPASHFGPPGMAPPVLGHTQSSGWGAMPMGNPPHSGVGGASGWGSAASASSQGQPFPAPTHHRTLTGNARAVTVRVFAVQAYKHLSSQSSGIENSGFFDISDVVRQTVESGRQMHVQPGIQLSEIRSIMDTAGDSSNGGGTFVIRMGDMKTALGGRTLVRWVPDQMANEASYSHQHLYAQQQHGDMQGGFGPGGGAPRHGLGLGEIGSPVADARLPNLGGIGRL